MRSVTLRTLMVLAVLFTGAQPAFADASDPGGTFTDDNGNVHEGGIEAIAAQNITIGCNPPANIHYCPRDSVTRGEMAVFLARAFSLPATGTDFFTDDNAAFYEGAANKLAAAGLTVGCAPDRYCGDRNITRGEMAAMLARVLKLPASSQNWFADDNGHIFEGAINRIADRGITKGCNPPSNTSFCPNDLVKRDEMATFITRALQLTSMKPPAVRIFGPGAHVVGSDIAPGIYRNTGFSDGCYWERLSGFSGDLADIIENEFTKVGQIVAIEASDAGFTADTACGTWTNQLVSSRQGRPASPFGPGTYRVPEEITPGTWRSVPVDFCYWERLSGFAGFDDIIVNEFTDVVTIAEIAPTDIGFVSEDGCGTWTKIG
jgi:hypothetical protein